MPKRFDWDLLQSFLAVARTGRLTVAARQLKIDHSTLGRRLTTLEAAIGARLFDRSVAGYSLTPQGENLLRRAEEMEGTVFALQSDIERDAPSVSGTVRIGTPDGFGTAILAPAIGQLAAAHPDLEIQLVAMPRGFSLSRREADIAVTLSRPNNGRLHARKLTDYELGVYAAKAAPELWRGVRVAGDLAGRPFISYIDDLIFAPELDYVPSVCPDIVPRLRSSNLLAQLQATISGAALCVLPCFLADNVSSLVRVLPDQVRLIRSFWMLTHSDMHDLARVRVTSKFIAETVQRVEARFLPTGASSPSPLSGNQP